MPFVFITMECPYVTSSPFILFLTDIVASSNSTDETIVADSDVEIDTATSDHTVAASKSQHQIEHGSDDKKEVTITTSEHAVNSIDDTI